MSHQEYWQHGLLHREGGAALVTTRLGHSYEEYWEQGQLHRAGGPAVWHDGVREEYWRSNLRHREDGPAVCVDGRIRLPLMDREFNLVPRISTALTSWANYPYVGDPLERIPNYLNNVFGGVHPFGTLGDFGATPTVMVNQLALNVDLGEVKYQISYDTVNWQDRFYSRADDKRSPGCEDDISQEDEPYKGDDGPDIPHRKGADGVGIFELLGLYTPKTQQITLFIKAIAECANRLDQSAGNLCGPSAMTLTTMVFLHELGHALHHAKRGGKPDDDLGGTVDAETVAQHFMMTCIRSYGRRAEWLAERLEHGQPAAYGAWQICGHDTRWDDCRRVFTRFQVP